MPKIYEIYPPSVALIKQGPELFQGNNSARYARTDLFFEALKLSSVRSITSLALRLHVVYILWCKTNPVSRAF
jgi:hypothetical protein